MPVATQNESKIPVGAVLVGKYRVIREIGRGGMAAVYEAEQLSIGKRVAIKVLASELSASNIVIERFFREARAAASVRSPHIVEVYDSGRLDDGRPFIAMEMLIGESLYERMAAVRIIDPKTTLQVIVQCAKGLVKAHQAGIVHRDLKPENIFLSQAEDGGDELVKILDFGLAKFYAPVAPDEKTKRLTREGAVFGTPAYMSPEQVKGQGNVDHRADLWALGCMAYECLIGRPVWNMDQGVAMTFASIATGPIPQPSKQRPDLPPGFDAWFRKALERDPNRRFQSAKELADAYVEVWGQRASSQSGTSSGRAPLSDPIIGLPSPEHSSPALYADSFPTGSDAFGQRPAGQSGDAPLSWDPASAPQPPPKASPVRLALSLAFAILSLTGAAVVWARFLKPQAFTTVQHSTFVPSSASLGAEATPKVASEEPAWAPLIAEGQRLFAASDFAAAQDKFREAVDSGAGAAGRGLIEQAKVAAGGGGACRIVALSHPRLGISGSATRPTIASLGKGAIVAWTDDHETPGRDHTYSVLVDANGKVTTTVRDLTPEATNVVRPLIVADGDHAVLLYADTRGADAGVRVRALDPDGRIAKASVLVGAGRPGNYWPAIDRAPQGYFVVWQDDRDGGDDLFLRKLSSTLEPLGNELRLTDYAGKPKTLAQVRYPVVAVAASTLLITYKLERDKDRLVYRMRIPLDSPHLAKGLDEPSDGGKEKSTREKKDRELGDVQLVNEDRARADAPAIACGTEGCFIAWHSEKGGAWAALIDPKEGRVVWRKRVAERGGHPGLGVRGGQVALVFYEASRVKIAFLSRDGVSTPMVLARGVGDHPRPSIAAGARPGEWLLAWEDNEPTTSAAVVRDVYAGRVYCK